MNEIVDTVADWLINDPEQAARWIIALMIWTAANSLLSISACTGNLAKIEGILKQLRSYGIWIWE